MNWELSKCVQMKMHLTSCDNYGFCNYCGYREEYFSDGTPVEIYEKFEGEYGQT